MNRLISADEKYSLFYRRIVRKFQVIKDRYYENYFSS